MASFIAKSYAAMALPLGKAAAAAARPRPRPKAQGNFFGFGSSKGYGLLAAPMIKPRPIGQGITPAIGGLFRRGPAIGISQINTIATNIMQGSGGS